MDKEKNQKQENMQNQEPSETSPELTKNQLILYCKNKYCDRAPNYDAI